MSRVMLFKTQDRQLPRLTRGLWYRSVLFVYSACMILFDTILLGVSKGTFLH